LLTVFLQEKKKQKNILQEVRLDHRTLDLRTPAMHAIARISDNVVRLFSGSLSFVQRVEKNAH